MSVYSIDSQLLRRLFLAGAQKLEDNKATINMLNVFPVPDGDTGTNMSMTLQSAVHELNALDPEAGMSDVCKAISSGSLRGARGNSGVILSQILRGFVRTVKDETEALKPPVLAAALAKATETAYKAVMKPTEGTILTVMHSMSDKALELNENLSNDSSSEDIDIVEMCHQVITEGQDTLNRTPEILPVLKEAGVVDSGGQGLICFMTGLYECLSNTDTSAEFAPMKKKPAESANKKEADPVIPQEKVRKPISTDNIKFGYCTEFLVLTESEVPIETENEFKEYLAGIGDSIVCVSDEEIIKVHVHTNDPGLAIQKGLTYGMLSNLKIDNMRIEHQNTLVTQAEIESSSAPEAPSEPVEKEPGFIAISSGEGISDLFSEMGVNKIIKGGQTMNPSTDDILTAIEELQADPVYILPNNKNIIMAANQARDLSDDCSVYVIPTKTIPQGIAAMIVNDSSLSPDENAAAMAENASMTKTLEVTYAVKTTKIQGHDIKEGDIMGLDDDGIKVCGRNIDEVALRLIERNLDEDSCVISLFAGEDIDMKDAEALVAKISEANPDLDVDLYKGGQAFYYYIISID